MPKAESTSRSSSPTKGSPSKRSYRVALPSIVNIPYGVPLNKVKVASNWTAGQDKERPKHKPPLFVTSIPKRDPPNGIFLSEDIFYTGPAGVERSPPDHSGTDATLPSPPDLMDEDAPNFNMEDLKDALDDSVLFSGLVRVLCPPISSVTYEINRMAIHRMSYLSPNKQTKRRYPKELKINSSGLSICQSS